VVVLVLDQEMVELVVLEAVLMLKKLEDQEIHLL
tara:strand:- start:441 stop:542 length:102 start_codon:yes stop_codon:yes gene_type:complete